MVTRFDLSAAPEALTGNSVRFGVLKIMEVPNGDYVRFSDYEALATSVSEHNKVDAHVHDALKAMFTSGNDIPVERIILTREQYEALVKLA